MSLGDLDSVLSPAKRLAILGMLVSTTKVEFQFIRDYLELSDSDLSKQLAALGDAGYIEVRKVGSRSKRRTWINLTTAGGAALEAHLAALNSLIHTEPVAPNPPPDLVDVATTDAE